MTLNSARFLLSDDLCSRRAWYSLRWRTPFLGPKEILYQAVEHGLCASGDAGDAAEAHAMDLAVDPGIDTPETDLLGLASHIASLAGFLAWLLRGDAAPWKRPEPIALPDGSPWTSRAFMDASETHLRRVVLMDRWDSWAQLALERSWDVAGECSAYGVGMDCLIVEIGSLRSGRWANPFTRGYRHPVSKTLRFRKRDGDDLGATWSKVEREHDSASRDEWLDALTDDGVLGEVVHIHSPNAPDTQMRQQLIDLAGRKLDQLRSVDCPPDPHFSQCFDRVRPCPFRSACPRGEEPSESLGFVRLHHAPNITS